MFNKIARQTLVEPIATEALLASPPQNDPRASTLTVESFTLNSNTYVENLSCYQQAFSRKFDINHILRDLCSRNLKQINNLIIDYFPAGGTALQEEKKSMQAKIARTIAESFPEVAETDGLSNYFQKFAAAFNSAHRSKSTLNDLVQTLDQNASASNLSYAEQLHEALVAVNHWLEEPKNQKSSKYLPVLALSMKLHGKLGALVDADRSMAERVSATLNEAQARFSSQLLFHGAVWHPENLLIDDPDPNLDAA